MKITIQGKPEFQFEVTESLLETFTKLSDMHYDAKCRFIGEYGFIMGWRNNMKWQTSDSNPEPNNVIDVHLNWRDLDLLMKICEHPAPFIKDADLIELKDFKHSVWKAMDLSNKSVGKWRVVLE